MRQKEFQVLSRKYLLPHLPVFEVKGDLLIIPPIKYLLRGFCFQPSAFDRKSFNVQTFVQPLYIPKEYIVFNIGFRLGKLTRKGEEWWEITPENEAEVMTDVLHLMKVEGLPFLNRLETPEDIATELQKDSPNESRLIIDSQTIAYSLILAGKYAEGLKELNRFIFLLSEEDELREWEKVLLERAILLRDTLKNHGEKTAIALLEEWRAYTIGKLRLEKFVER